MAKKVKVKFQPRKTAEPSVIGSNTDASFWDDVDDDDAWAEAVTQLLYGEDIVKGGPGSGNWGHVGRPGKLGGSQSNKFAMSIVMGRTAAERQAAARVGGKVEQPASGVQPGVPGNNPSIDNMTSDDARAEGMLNTGLQDVYNVDETWRSADYAKRGQVKRQIVDAVHARIPADLEVTKDDVNETLKTWADSSNDSSDPSLSLQQAASEEFGIPLSDWQQQKIDHNIQYNMQYRVSSNLQSVNGMSRPQERAVLRAMYDNTQEQLAAAGYKPTDSIQLYRGITVRNAAGDLVAMPRGVANYTGNAIESWSSSSSVATNSFSYYGYRNVLSQSVPVKNIVGTCRSGLGCLSEAEFVVMGVPGTQVMVTNIGHSTNIYTQ